MGDEACKSSDEILAELFTALGDSVQLESTAATIGAELGRKSEIGRANTTDQDASSILHCNGAIVPPPPPDVTAKKKKDKDPEKRKRKKEKKSKKGKKKKKEKDEEKHGKKDKEEEKATRSDGNHKTGKVKKDKKEKRKHIKDGQEKLDPSVKDRSRSADRKSKEKDREKEPESDRKDLRDSRRDPPRDWDLRDRLESGHRSDRERRDIEKYHSRKRTRNPSRSRSTHRKARTRSRSRSPAFDKAQLLEVARRNLKKLQDKGVSLGVEGENLRIVKCGGRTVEELTDFCKHLVEKDGAGSAEEGEVSSDGETNPVEDKPFTRHPFQLKPRSDPIVMNIRNAVPLPVRKPEERSQLKQQFPVSSGQQHRVNELEWVPVVPKPAPVAAAVAPVKRKKEVKDVQTPAEVIPSSKTAVVSPETDPTVAAANIDISAVVAQRLSAIRRLQDNPRDIVAQLELQEADFHTKNWAEAQHTNPLTGEQMQHFVNFSEAPPAWARKNQFKEAAPVAGGVGMRLLQKMGWQPGQGLGRNKEGTLEPLALDVKMDKKGLVSKEEIAPKPVAAKLIQEFNGKHPVSILHELCTKQRWGPPVFEQLADIGPDHQKHFLFKVIVNNVDYRPCVASTTKKEAKAQAAAICLQALGVMPS